MVDSIRKVVKIKKYQHGISMLSRDFDTEEIASEKNYPSLEFGKGCSE
jgi:hypothetical protein